HCRGHRCRRPGDSSPAGPAAAWESWGGAVAARRDRGVWPWEAPGKRRVKRGGQEGETGMQSPKRDQVSLGCRPSEPVANEAVAASRTTLKVGHEAPGIGRSQPTAYVIGCLLYGEKPRVPFRCTAAGAARDAERDVPGCVDTGTWTGAPGRQARL